MWVLASYLNALFWILLIFAKILGFSGDRLDLLPSVYIVTHKCPPSTNNDGINALFSGCLLYSVQENVISWTVTCFTDTVPATCTSLFVRSPWESASELVISTATATDITFLLHYANKVQLAVHGVGRPYKAEDHWSCIVPLSAEEMLKSAVIEEKKFKHSPLAGADNSLVLNFWCQQEGLLAMCCTFEKNLFGLWLYTHLSWFNNVYSLGSGTDNPRGQNFDVNRNLLSLRSFATSFKQISLKVCFYRFF